MNRKEAWNAFIARVQTQPLSSKCQYLDNEGHYCVVGHALSVAGIPDPILREMGGIRIENQFQDITDKLFETYGVSVDALNMSWEQLQEINDTLNKSPSIPKESLPPDTEVRTQLLDLLTEFQQEACR